MACAATAALPGFADAALVPRRAARDDAPMKSDLIRVFQTLEHPCGYYADRNARNLVIDPLARGLPQVYGSALERGFRRSGLC